MLGRYLTLQLVLAGGKTLCRTEVEILEQPMLALVELGRRANSDPTLGSTSGRNSVEGNRLVFYTAPPGLPLDP